MKGTANMRKFVFFGFCAAILSLSGCQGAFDPLQRPGTWSATNASNETIAQQVANKGDLIQGRSDPGTNGVVAVGGLEKALTNGTGTGLQTTIQGTVPGGMSIN
jgi:hypothetical protein